MWHEGATKTEEEKQEFIHIAMAKFAGAVGQGEERDEPTIAEGLDQERTDELYTRNFDYSTEVNVLSQQYYEKNADPETGVVEAMRIRDDNSTYSIMYSTRDGKFGVYVKPRDREEIREAEDKEIGRIGYLAETCTQRSRNAPEEY